MITSIVFLIFPFLFLLPLFHVSFVVMALQQSMPMPSQIHRCSADGVPALFPCNPSRESGRLVFVCAADLSLGCEQFDGQFFCCAPHLEKSPVEMLQKIVRVEEKHVKWSIEMAPTNNSENGMTTAKKIAFGNSSEAKPTPLASNRTLTTFPPNISIHRQKGSASAAVSTTFSSSTTTASAPSPVTFSLSSPSPLVVTSSIVNVYSQLLFPMILLVGDGRNGTGEEQTKTIGNKTEIMARKCEQQKQREENRSNTTTTTEKAMPKTERMTTTTTTRATKRENGTLTNDDTTDNGTLTNGANETKKVVANTSTLPSFFTKALAIVDSSRSTITATTTAHLSMAKNSHSDQKQQNISTKMAISISNSSSSVGILSTTPMAFVAPCIDLVPQCWWSGKLCNNPRYSRLLRLQCPKTCDRCAANGMDNDGKQFRLCFCMPVVSVSSSSSVKVQCLDKGKDCPRVAFLCRTIAYGALMASECVKTCGKCGGDGNEREKQQEKKRCEARDNYPRCALWRLQGFCTSPKYSKHLKSRYCAKTCAICERSDDGSDKVRTDN